MQGYARDFSIDQAVLKREPWKDDDSTRDILTPLKNELRNIEAEIASSDEVVGRATVSVTSERKSRRFSDQLSFKTARSSFSAVGSSAVLSLRSSMAISFRTAQSNPSKHSLIARQAGGIRPKKNNIWIHILKLRDLVPPQSLEQNWSGIGQHVEFTNPKELPLLIEGTDLGPTVDVVICRRIRLARKKIFFRNKLSRERAADEVSHLQHLNHAHIVRVIGTYVLPAPRSVNLLLYPVTEYNLESFLHEIWGKDVEAGITWTAPVLFAKPDYLPQFQLEALESLSSFFRCLTNTMHYLHGSKDYVVKHMDIKPANILVRDMRMSSIHHSERFKVYLSDFGIARSYDSAQDADTSSLPSFTKIWAAPEVVENYRDNPDVPRGLAADIFSLGCVFAEMICALAGSYHWDELRQTRERNLQDQSFQANRTEVTDFLEILYDQSKNSFCTDTYMAFPTKHCTDTFMVFPIKLCVQMLSLDPLMRPSAAGIIEEVGFQWDWECKSPDALCCECGADVLEPAVGKDE